MSTKRRRRRTGGTIQLDAVLAASNRLSIMHEGLIEQGYSCSGGKLSLSFTERGLKLA